MRARPARAHDLDDEALGAERVGRIGERLHGDAATGAALDLPLDLAAGVGLAALFGAAANIRIALSIMAVELLGANVAPHVVIVSVIAYLMAGHRGIYPAQRLGRKKSGERISRPVPLRDYRSDVPPALFPVDGAAKPAASQKQGEAGR